MDEKRPDALKVVGLTPKQYDLIDWFIDTELEDIKSYIKLRNYSPAATSLRELANRLDGLESALNIFENH